MCIYRNIQRILDSLSILADVSISTAAAAILSFWATGFSGDDTIACAVPFPNRHLRFEKDNIMVNLG